MSLAEEEKTYPQPKPARLTTIRELKPALKGPVRIMCIVIEAQTGVAIVQDIYDDVEKAASIKVIFDGDLEPEKRYLLLGALTEKSTSSGKELILNATLAYNIDTFDIKKYKEALDTVSE